MCHCHRFGSRVPDPNTHCPLSYRSCSPLITWCHTYSSMVVSAMPALIHFSISSYSVSNSSPRVNLNFNVIGLCNLLHMLCSLSLPAVLPVCWFILRTRNCEHVNQLSKPYSILNHKNIFHYTHLTTTMDIRHSITKLHYLTQSNL